MKNIIIGIIIGITLGGIAWASMQRTILLSPNENPLGITENPIYITSP